MGNLTGMEDMGGGMGLVGGSSSEGVAGGIDPRRLWGNDFDTGNQADGGNGMYCESSASFLNLSPSPACQHDAFCAKM